METEYKSPSMSRRQLLAAYMKARKKALCLGVICIVIFLVIMLLFYYPVDGIIYASILCACAAVIFSISDFNSFIQRHRRLEPLHDHGPHVPGLHGPDPVHHQQRREQRL